MSDVGAVFSQSVEARIVKLEGERNARLSLAEARNRLLDALDSARQGHVRQLAVSGDLFRNEKEQVDGVQVIALADLNAALDEAFPDRE